MILQRTRRCLPIIFVSMINMKYFFPLINIDVIYILYGVFMSGKSFLQVVDSSESFTNGVWRLNQNLVVNKTAVFPDRCIICNDDACGHHINKTFIWHNPLLLACDCDKFSILSLLATFWKKILRLEIPVCPKHYFRIQVGTTCSFICFLKFLFWV